jgi:antitoxin YefM
MPIPTSIPFRQRAQEAIHGRSCTFMAVHCCLAAQLRPKGTQCCTLFHMAKIVPFTEARANLTELLDDVEDKHEHVLITRNGRPAAVMVSPDEYESLEETLEILQDKDLMRALRKSEDDVRAGRLTSLEDVRNRRDQ